MSLTAAAAMLAVGIILAVALWCALSEDLPPAPAQAPPAATSLEQNRDFK
jgi:hypothetical protein